MGHTIRRFLVFPADTTGRVELFVGECLQRFVGVEATAALKTSTAQPLARAELRRRSLSGAASFHSRGRVHYVFMRRCGACSEQMDFEKWRKSAALEAVLMVRSKRRHDNARRTVPPPTWATGRVVFSIWTSEQ
jgi:hypothetical protein